MELACPEDESWSAGNSTLSLSRRTRSPEAAPQPSDTVIEEIDLTLTPRPEVSAAGFHADACNHSRIDGRPLCASLSIFVRRGRAEGEGGALIRAESRQLPV